MIARLILAIVTIALSPSVTAFAGPHRPSVIVRGEVDVDRDGVADTISIESEDAERIRDREPCASCGDRIHGHFAAVVKLSGSHRTVRTPVALHPAIGDTMWFWYAPPGQLAVGDYNCDGHPDFNLGQFTNSIKWEYGLFTVFEDGHVEQFAVDRPEIYVSPGGKPSSHDIKPIPCGFEFRDYGNAGDSPGWWVFSCRWHSVDRSFTCNGKPEIPKPQW